MTPGRRVCAIVAAMTAAACAHSPPPPLSRAHLVVQTANGGVRPFVRATVAGEPVMLLVDTGATDSMLPAKFARAHRLRTGRPASDVDLVDANGRLTTMRRLPDVLVQFEGEAAGGTIDFLMNASGAADVGVLAPQDLVRAGWALVIDLEREELRYEPEQAALARVGDLGAPLREIDFSGCLDEGFFERSHRLVGATINGVAVKMLIDTGAERTVLARNNPALRSMMAKTGARGNTAGLASVGAGLLVEDVPIVFAETPFVGPAVVLPASQLCGHGLIGADLLRHCTLVWGWSKLWAACRAPGERR